MELFNSIQGLIFQITIYASATPLFLIIIIRND